MNSGKSQAKYIKKSACLFPWICYNILTPPLRAAYRMSNKKRQAGACLFYRYMLSNRYIDDALDKTSAIFFGLAFGV